MTEIARILFAGSPDFAVPALNRLVDAGHALVAVLTQPDRPAGRGRQLRASPVKRLASDLGIPVLQPGTLTGTAIQDDLRRLSADLMVVVAYGLLLPEAVLAMPSSGCVNLHASLLPRWRGASPVQAALLAGDQHTGISLMQMDRGLDTGPVLTQQSLDIGACETAGELQDRLAELGARMLGEQLDAILAGSLQGSPQSEADASHAPLIRKQDAAIDWTVDAVGIDRAIRAYNPWPVAETRLGGEQLRCWISDLPSGGNNTGVPGQIMAVTGAGVDVQTGEGMLRLVEVQLPGRRRVAAADWAKTRPLVGEALGA